MTSGIAMYKRLKLDIFYLEQYPFSSSQLNSKSKMNLVFTFR